MITGEHRMFLNSLLTDITAIFLMKTTISSNSRDTEPIKSMIMLLSM